MGYLDLWTVYDHPADFPNEWVVRSWRIEPGRDPRQGRALTAPTLEEVRELIPRDRFGLHRVPAEPGDDPCIYETWV